MGFGQYASADKGKRDKGYPEGTTKLKTGRMTLDEIMADLKDDPILSTKISAHNEVTILYAGGTVVCRLRETNIVTLGANKVNMIDTGGWNTLTTRRHVVNFLERHGFQLSLWGDKKRGGNVLTLYVDGKPGQEIVFKQRVMFNKGGGFKSDLDTGSPFKLGASDSV